MSHFTSMMNEARSGIRDLKPTLPRGQRLKQLAFRSSPLVVLAAAGTVGLVAKKRREPPEPASTFLSSQSAFRCAPVQRLLAPSELQKAGADIDSLCRATRRMRGPVERELAAAECLLAGAAGGAEEIPPSSMERAARALQLELPLAATGTELRRQLWAKLVEAWRGLGYFSEPVEFQKPRPSVWSGLNPVTSEDESYGRDVGSQVPVCMLESKADCHRLSPAQLGPAADALQEHGVVLLNSFLPEAQIVELRRKLQMHTSALDVRSQRKRVGSRETGPIREYDTNPLVEADSELQYVYSSIGRKHFCLRGRLLEETVREVQAGAMPLIWEHLSSVPRSSSSTGSPYVSEIQLVVTEPGAMEQFWHVDNIAPGLTLVVPLTPVPEDMGPNLFMTGSHQFFAQESNVLQRLQSCASSLLRSNGAAVATMEAGDALLYDSRVVHRGNLNRRYDRSGVSLIFRYDIDRPPGYGPVGTILISYAGSVLAGFVDFYAMLPGK